MLSSKWKEALKQASNNIKRALESKDEYLQYRYPYYGLQWNPILFSPHRKFSAHQLQAPHTAWHILPDSSFTPMFLGV